MISFTTDMGWHTAAHCIAVSLRAACGAPIFWYSFFLQRDASYCSRFSVVTTRYVDLREDREVM